MPTDTLIYNSTGLTATLSASNLVTTTTSGSNCWQGTVIDFGATRAEVWLAKLEAAFATAPTAGGTLELYMSWNDVSTGPFPGGCSGSDASYPGPSGVPADALKQLTFAGSFIAVGTGSTVKQVKEIGPFQARKRYACPVLAMRTTTALNGASSSFSLTFLDIRPQSQ